jgi:Tfp pilus assembly protein PilV
MLALARIVMSVRHARQQRRGAPILQDAQAEIDAGRGALEQLARYHGREIPHVAAGQ